MVNHLSVLILFSSSTKDEAPSQQVEVCNCRFKYLAPRHGSLLEEYSFPPMVCSSGPKTHLLLAVLISASSTGTAFLWLHG